MKPDDIDLNPGTRGERWFQYALNHAPGKNWSIFFLSMGFVSMALYFWCDYPKVEMIFLVMAIGQLFTSYLYYERYQARKIILRLLENQNEKTSEKLE